MNEQITIWELLENIEKELIQRKVDNKQKLHTILKKKSFYNADSQEYNVLNEMIYVLQEEFHSIEKQIQKIEELWLYDFFTN